jgi:hypothetical protein
MEPESQLRHVLDPESGAKGEKMRRVMIAAALSAAVATLAATTASAGGLNPWQLQRAGWSCVNPAAAFPANPNVHCFPRQATSRA